MLALALNGSSGAFVSFRFGAGVSSCSGAVVDDDAATAALSSFDLDRDFVDSAVSFGLGVELRPLAGLL